MLSAESVIRLTGQYWKLMAGIGLLLIGSFAPLFSTIGMSWTGGTILAIAGYAFACLAIRCPGCGSRWFWQAALDAGLYRPLFTRSACPQCQRDFGQNR
jgi:hypothetical protein